MDLLNAIIMISLNGMTVSNIEAPTVFEEATKRYQ